MKTSNQKGSGHQPGLGAKTLPGLDPATFSANLKQFFRASGKVMDHWRQVSDEICEFGKWCLKRNMEAAHNATRHGSVDEALMAQTELGSKIAEAYIAESGRLAQMTTDAIFEGLSAWKVAASRTDAAATKHLEAAE
jgi:hypothetical protein